MTENILNKLKSIKREHGMTIFKYNYYVSKRSKLNKEGLLNPVLIKIDNIYAQFFIKLYDNGLITSGFDKWGIPRIKKTYNKKQLDNSDLVHIRSYFGISDEKHLLQLYIELLNEYLLNGLDNYLLDIDSIYINKVGSIKIINKLDEMNIKYTIHNNIKFVVNNLYGEKCYYGHIDDNNTFYINLRPRYQTDKMRIKEGEKFTKMKYRDITLRKILNE